MESWRDDFSKESMEIAEGYGSVLRFDKNGGLLPLQQKYARPLNINPYLVTGKWRVLPVLKSAYLSNAFKRNIRFFTQTMMNSFI